jgi:tRNA(Ile)-lysidine synthase
MDLADQFRERWVKAEYIGAEETVLLAVSGGSDSMVMADLFLKSKLKFAVAHCNFGLRAEASDLDELLVSGWCAASNINFHTVRFDTKQKAAEWKKGTQETARDLRYQWFEMIRKEHGYAKIVTAHHANDNVETMLINLFKGTGISGLHGIRPVNGHIIRPLLFADKTMIAAYASKINVPYRDDASNETDDYLRNAVRHNVVPAVEQWFPGMIGKVNDSISRFSDAEMLYLKAIDRERKQLLEHRGQDYYIPILKLSHRKPLNTICYELLHPFGFSSQQIPEALRLLTAESGHYMVSQTHRIIRNRNFLIITTLPTPTADLIIVEAAPCAIDTGNYIFTFSVKNKSTAIPTDINEAWLDLDTLTFPLMLRKWRNGDYMYPLGMKMKKKKVSRLFIDCKISLPDKEDIRLLECNKKIAWASGVRIDERFKIKANTEKVLVIRREKK